MKSLVTFPGDRVAGESISINYVCRSNMANNEAFVQLEPWFYQSPQLLRAGRKIDIGLLAEALIYYDTVYFGHTNDEQFARIAAWFKGQGAIAEFIALLNDRALVPYYYAFATLPGQKDDVWFVYNIQDEESARQPVFNSRILNSGRLHGLVKKHNVFSQIEHAAMAHHVEVKAEDFAAGLANARADYEDAQRSAFLLQIVVDELYRDLGFIKPPEIEATIVRHSNGIQTTTYNFDFRLFARKLGPALNFHPGTPLAGAAYGSKTLWSAAQVASDLYLASPLTSYARYKLDEGNRTARARAIMQELIAEVAFPDIRDLVNRDLIGVRDVLLLRRKAKRFRDWLRSESTFDRNAVIAYLGELAVEAGWKRNVRKVISAVGIFGGVAAGAQLAGPIGAVGGAIAGEALKYLTDLGTRLDGGWKPKVFGEFARATVDRARKHDHSREY